MSIRRRVSGRAALGLWFRPPLLILGPLFALLAAWSWRKWCDVLVDFGNELYVPWRMTEGDVLYRDLAFVVGPASQYWNAFLFWLFGVSLTTLIVANLAILAAITVLLFRIFVRAGDRFGATCVSAFFLVVFAFSQYFGVGNYNYICPYRHEMTHGLALCLVQLVCLVRFAEGGGWGMPFAAGLCCGLNLMMKIEIFAAAAAMALVACVLLTLGERPRPNFSRIAKAAACFVAGTLLPVGFFLVILCRELSLQQALAGMFGQWLLAMNPELTTRFPMYETLMGLDDPSGRLRSIAVALCLLAGAIALGVAVDGLTRPVTRHRRWLCVVVFAVTAGLAANVVPPNFWFNLRIVLPFTSMLAGTIFAVRLFRRRDDPAAFRTGFPLVLWSTLAVALLPKMLLNTQLGHYGFVLAMPAALLLVHCCVTAIPQALQIRWGTGDVFRSLMLALVVYWALPHWMRADAIYRGKQRPVGEGGDLSYHDPRAGDRSEVIPQAIDHLKRVLPDDATLLVLPYGIHINYLLRKRNPTPYFLMTPWEMKVAGGEEAVLEAIRRAQPDYIAIIHTELLGLGYDYFGVPGYGAQIRAWVDAHYRNVHRITRRDPRGELTYQFALFQRTGG